MVYHTMYTGGKGVFTLEGNFMPPSRPSLVGHCFQLRRPTVSRPFPVQRPKVAVFGNFDFSSPILADFDKISAYETQISA